MEHTSGALIGQDVSYTVKLKRELGQIQRIDLLYPSQGTKGPPRVAIVNSKQTLTQKAVAAELLRTDGG